MILGVTGNSKLEETKNIWKPGVESRECRSEVLLVRHGSGSSVGSPVADVVVVHVLVDIRRIKLGGRLRRNRYNTQKQQV